MRWVRPRVDVIAETRFAAESMAAYLTATYGIVPRPSMDEGLGADLLIEAAGRACYRSFAPGLNKNVTKVRAERTEYLRNIISSHHGSVLEHASVTFLISGVSRVFTHELVRHRAGCAFSQESLRYVRLDDIPIAETPRLRADAALRLVIEAQARHAEIAIAEYGRQIGIDDMAFADKKAATSLMRRLAPEGLATTIVWTANIRALRHVIELRTAAGVEEEMREVMSMVARRAVSLYPTLFGDFTEHPDGSWVPTHSKV